MANPTTSSGECVVCGTKTEKKCSECAKFGTDWMFFCSSEHQKLIWYLHKRVCGERSNPFQWPQFKKQEIDDIEVYAQKSVQLGPLRSSQTWWDAIGPSRDSDETDENGFGLRKTLEQAMTSNAIARLRKAAYRVHYGSLVGEGLEGEDATAQAMEANAYNFFIYAQEGILEGTAQNTAGCEQWWSEFQHKYIILSALVFHKTRSPTGRSLELERQVSEAGGYATEEFDRFLREDVARTHPTIAHAFLQFIDTTVVTD